MRSTVHLEEATTSSKAVRNGGQLPRRLTQTEEAKFAALLQNAIDKKVQQLRGRWGDTTEKIPLQTIEKRAIQTLEGSTSALRGALAGTVVFVAIRSTRARVLPYLMSSHRRNTSNSSREANHSKVKYSPFSTKQHTRQKSLQPTALFNPDIPGESPFFKLFDLALDTLSSFFLGATVFVLDLYKSMEDIPKIPLTQGHSILSEEFCPVVLRELHALQRRIKQDKLLPTGSFNAEQRNVRDLYLRRMLHFADNCERRRRYAQKLNPDVNQAFRVSIPFPGVPSKEDVSHEFTSDGPE